MFKALRQLFGSKSSSRPRVPDGARVYAVGDIHGCHDLFRALGRAIEEDDHRRGAADTTVILLGDLIDRGPGSAAVIAAARQWQGHRKVRILMGNHEEMLLNSLENPRTFNAFMRHGGRETALSYPIDEAAFEAARAQGPESAMAMMRAAIPDTDIAFIRAFEPMIAMGDYLFVHAGIQPGIPFDLQSPIELLWIREPFLSDTRDHGAVVVHGHTITERPDMRANRIGLDTGAYASGRLTAMGFEGSERWVIEASDSAGTITTAISAAAA